MVRCLTILTWRYDSRSLLVIKNAGMLPLQLVISLPIWLQAIPTDEEGCRGEDQCEGQKKVPRFAEPISAD